MLKSASDTKAFWASSTLCSSTSTYTVKVDRATYTVSKQEGETRVREKHLNVIVANLLYDTLENCNFTENETSKLSFPTNETEF